MTGSRWQANLGGGLTVETSGILTTHHFVEETQIETESQRGDIFITTQHSIFSPEALQWWFHGDQCMVFIQADGISWKAHQVPGFLLFFLYDYSFLGDILSLSLSFLSPQVFSHIGNGIHDHISVTETIIAWKMFSILPEYRKN